MHLSECAESKATGQAEQRGQKLIFADILWHEMGQANVHNNYRNDKQACEQGSNDQDPAHLHKN